MTARLCDEAERLVGIMARLRDEGGCPWDREQDLRSLRPYLLEEAFEVLEEMDRVAFGGPWSPLCEELGDLLFQIVFHARLASEAGGFSLADVMKTISDKIVRRHPHVFGDARTASTSTSTSANAVLESWARLKAKERKERHGDEGSVLDGVPLAAPSLMRAERLSEKASRIGFDWPDLAGVRQKLDEELAELDRAIVAGDRDQLEHELGDVLFSVANLARFIKTPPEDALRQANRRFTERFRHVERALRAEGVPFGEATLEQMEAHWQAAKAAEKQRSLLGGPSHLPRAGVRALTLPTPRVLALRAFLGQLADVLGWESTPTGEFDVGGLVLRVVEGGGAPALTVVLEAPSPEGVARLGRLLPSLGASEIERDAAGISFQAPDGSRWRYESA